MFQKGRERRQNRRADRKERRAERRDKRGDNAKVGLAIGAATVAVGAGVAAYKNNKNKKSAEAEEGVSAQTYSSDDYSSSDSDMDDEFEIKHPSEYTVLEVQYFLMAIGMENKCEIFEEKQVNGQVMITITKKELEVDYGCSSIEIKKFMAAVEFSFEVCEGSNKPDTPTCKPPKQWTEAEVCLILVAIGMGGKVEQIKKAHITGAVAVSLTTVELSKECGMTTVEVKKFQAIIVKGDKGGCSIEPEVDTMPSDPQLNSGQPNVESDGGPSKGAVIGIAVGGAVVAGGLGYLAWKKCQENNKDEEPNQEIQQEENVDPEFGVEPPVDPEFGVEPPVDPEFGVEPPPPIKHPCDFTYVEVKFFLIAIGMENKCEIFEEKKVDGQVLVTLTKTELEAEFGCTSIEVRKFTMAIEFSIEISENPPKPEEPQCGCKPSKDWSEIEVCLVLVAIGCGSRVEDFRKNHVSGAMAVSMTKVELQQECGMTTVEVKKFKAVAVVKK